MFDCICGSPDAVDDKVLAPTGEQSAQPEAPDPTLRIEATNQAIYEEFKSQLVSGQIKVIKHCSDKCGRQRVLFCDPGLKTIGWKEPGMERKNPPLPLAQPLPAAASTDSLDHARETDSPHPCVRCGGCSRNLDSASGGEGVLRGT